MGTMWKPDLSNAGKSKYQALAGALRKGIAEGVLKKGSKLPPVRELAYRASVTPGTVARAYSLLIDEGLLEAGVGRGTFVANTVLPENAKPEPAAAWPDVVSLRSPLLPETGQTALIREAMRDLAGAEDTICFNRYPGRDNDAGLRGTIVDYLAGKSIGRITADEIVLTHGAQNAVLSVLQTLLTGPEPVVLMEQHAYPGFRRAAELCRAQAVSVECDDEGPLPDMLEDAARRHRAQVFLTSSEVNNPTLRCTSPRRRREIAEVARRNGLHVVDDDCYSHREAVAESYRALLPELGWYVSSVSKTLSPALRIGWAIGPRGRGSSLARTVAYGCYGLAGPLIEIGHRVLSDPRLPWVQTALQDEIGKHVRMAVNHLGGHDVSWHEEVPFLWISLPGGWRASRFARAAQEHGVRIKSSEDFVLRDKRAPHSVRIAINGHVAPACFETAVDKIRVLLDNPQDEITV